ncbi:MAG: hypothetical protein H6Q11_1649 [Acidobacteria bacterium]|nr:hypothetical protein [Acidobacteriota bacterium]
MLPARLPTRITRSAVSMASVCAGPYVSRMRRRACVEQGRDLFRRGPVEAPRDQLGNVRLTEAGGQRESGVGVPAVAAAVDLGDRQHQAFAKGGVEGLPLRHRPDLPAVAPHLPEIPEQVAGPVIEAAREGLQWVASFDGEG